MLLKMWHKKWMNISLLLGCILLVATVVSFPIYREAAYNRMLQDEFVNHIEEKGKWPTYLFMTVNSKKDKGGATISKMENLLSDIYTDMRVKEYQTICYYHFNGAQFNSLMKRNDNASITVKLSGMSDIEKHARMLSGEMFSEKGINENGEIEVVVSQATLVTNNLLVGEVFETDAILDENKKPVRVVIKGVFDAEDTNDFYWQVHPDRTITDLYMNMDLFRSMFTGENAGRYTLSISYYALIDYESITSDNVRNLLNRTNYYAEESSFKSVIKNVQYVSLLEDYLDKETRISATLMILQVPVLVMLTAFLFMISGQMYEMERNEISVIKSRGSSGGQIFRLYLYQGFCITLVGTAIGMPLGAIMARILGATRNFLEFDLSEKLDVTYTVEAMFYALGAMLLCLISITLPAIKHSKVSIVNLKQQKAVKKKTLWEKLYLDVILILASLYGYYSFHKNANVALEVSSGKNLDPLLYISSSLFILGAGLLFLRIQPFLVRLIYQCGKKKWKPATHVSFMDNIKNGRKQQLIMLFLILTVSLGMYHATVARTILQNAIKNTEYLTGSDVIIKEVWKTVTDEQSSKVEYIVPDYSKYAGIDFANSYTKVIYDPSSYIYAEKNDRQPLTIMAINTKEFGEATSIDRSLLEKQYYAYLNDLAVADNGVLVSRNFNTKLGYKEGDSVYYYLSTGKALSGKIVGFFDYWPGYLPSTTALNSDGSAYEKDNYCVVTHYDYVVTKAGTTPYEVWIDLKDDVEPIEVYNWITENGVNLRKYENRISNIDKTMEDPLLQGTNGVLTMGFVVTIVLCAVGYLIYWIMSIKERELMFGVLRATGLHKSEIFQMLINEQIFCGLFSVWAGVGIGKLTSGLFVPILQEAYASKNQALPMKLITDASDMIRLYGVIAFVMLLALAVLLILVLRMNVTKALKLGEE